MSGDPARVTSSQPEPARARVSPWPRVLARAAPGNLACLHPQPQLVAAVFPVLGVLAVVVRPSRGCLAAVCGDWGLESCDCCQPAATTATVPHCTLYHRHCTIHHFGGYFIFNSRAKPQYLHDRQAFKKTLLISIL